MQVSIKFLIRFGIEFWSLLQSAEPRFNCYLQLFVGCSIFREVGEVPNKTSKQALKMTPKSMQNRFKNRSKNKAQTKSEKTPKWTQNVAIWSPGPPTSEPRTQKMHRKWHSSAPCYTAGVRLVGLARSPKKFPFSAYLASDQCLASSSGFQSGLVFSGVWRHLVQFLKICPLPHIAAIRNQV